MHGRIAVGICNETAVGHDILSRRATGASQGRPRNAIATGPPDDTLRLVFRPEQQDMPRLFWGAHNAMAWAFEVIKSPAGHPFRPGLGGKVCGHRRVEPAPHAPARAQE